MSTANHGIASPPPPPPPPTRSRARVLAQLPEGNGRRLRLAVPGWQGSLPGQFLMLGAGAEGGAIRRDPLLPRPMAVYRELGNLGAGEVRDEAGLPARVIEVLYRVVGRGTALIADLREGERVPVVGPLGRGFLQVDPAMASAPGAPTPEPARDRTQPPALLVGGGTGIASLYEWARVLAERGRRVVVMLGARTRRRSARVVRFRGPGRRARRDDRRRLGGDAGAGHRTARGRVCARPVGPRSTPSGRRR